MKYKKVFILVHGKECTCFLRARPDEPAFPAKELSNVYVMSEEELYHLLSETFNAGDDYASYSFGKTASEKPNLAKFIKDKLKTTTP